MANALEKTRWPFALVKTRWLFQCVRGALTKRVLGSLSSERYCRFPAGQVHFHSHVPNGQRSGKSSANKIIKRANKDLPRASKIIV